MFDKFKKPVEVDKPTNVPVTTTSELDLLRKHVENQEQVIRELFEMVKLMANHKRFEYIQKKIDTIQILLDKITESK